MSYFKCKSTSNVFSNACKNTLTGVNFHSREIPGMPCAFRLEIPLKTQT